MPSEWSDRDGGAVVSLGAQRDLRAWGSPARVSAALAGVQTSGPVVQGRGCLPPLWPRLRKPAAPRLTSVP